MTFSCSHKSFSYICYTLERFLWYENRRSDRHAWEATSSCWFTQTDNRRCRSKIDKGEIPRVNREHALVGIRAWPVYLSYCHPESFSSGFEASDFSSPSLCGSSVLPFLLVVIMLSMYMLLTSVFRILPSLSLSLGGCCSPNFIYIFFLSKDIPGYLFTWD